MAFNKQKKKKKIIAKFLFAVKRPNGGTVRKHMIKKLNGSGKSDDKTAKSDINQNNASNEAASAVDTSNLSESTIQAFQDALHFKPLSQSPRSDDPTQAIVDDQIAAMFDERHADDADQVNGNSVTRDSENNRKLFQGISLKDFEKHHKLMKEANIEKRKLLSSAIEKRYAYHFPKWWPDHWHINVV